MKALDLANYIILVASRDYPTVHLTHLKLQKILYYILTSHLKMSSGSDLPFSEKIEKWQFGPVVSSVYDEFKNYGGRAITTPASSIEFNKNGLGFQIKEFNEENFASENPDLKNTADQVIEKLIHKDAFTLVDMTHREKAWLDAEASIKNGGKGIQYSLEELKNATNIL